MSQITERLVEVSQLAHILLLHFLFFIFLELIAVNELLTDGFIRVNCVHQVAVTQYE